MVIIRPARFCAMVIIRPARFCAMVIIRPARFLRYGDYQPGPTFTLITRFTRSW